MNKHIELIKEIQRTGFNLLMDLTNFNESDSGYGLTLDNSINKEVASIATSGFTLASYIIGVKYGYISHDEALKRVQRTLETLLYNVPHFNGFFAHFVNIRTALRHNKCEYSTIDTLLCIKGVIAVDTFFNNPIVTNLSKQLMDRINWKLFVHEFEGRPCFYMSYNPDPQGAYANGKPGFIHQWDMLAEQTLMYLVAASSDDIEPSLALKLYEGFDRQKASYMGHEFLLSPGNSLFVYQYPICFFDAKNYVDSSSVSWFDNLKNVTLAQRAWNLRNLKYSKTFSKHTFGLTASSTPKGYGVAHALPNNMNKLISDGTVAPNAMIGSLVTNPKEAINAITYMKSLPNLWGEYGFIDAYNFDLDTPWYSKKYITIDKGLEVLMANHYLSKDVVNAFMEHPVIKKGISILKWKKI